LPLIAYTCGLADDLLVKAADWSAALHTGIIYMIDNPGTSTV